jgi:hypothetical protein
MTTPGADERRDVKSFAKRAFQGTVAKSGGSRFSGCISRSQPGLGRRSENGRHSGHRHLVILDKIVRQSETF